MIQTNIEELKEGLQAPNEVVVKTLFGELLTPKYTFDTFVVGSSNQFAHASALAVANKPSVYNPLFIAGKTGLGKTHLLKAIGYKLATTRPELRICYYSTQRFMEEVIQSIQHNTRHELRESFTAKCDVLLMDDIQFLARASSTQDEFFHIFNTLFDASKQIVITSDRLPKEISDVNDRIISRFEWGMVANIEPPELETRVAILKSRAATDNIHLSDDVAYLIGTYVKANIRELEGSLTKIAGHAAFYKQAITTDLVRKVLRNYISERQKIISMDEIIATVAQFYSLKSSDIRGTSKKGPVARARQIVMYLARELTGLSCSAVGGELGGKHHTTILYGHEYVGEKIKADPILKAQVTQLSQQLTASE
ncbi:MAG: chromosomal replication initiator protein DnaA [Bdellovibrionales bacterium]|nr:chromosomal replication initiator protein DnaA [Bdellovibrionales bacterium]